LRWDVVLDNADILIGGMLVTVAASLITLLASTVLGLVLALVRTTGPRPLRTLTRVYVEFVQNVPSLIIVLFLYHGLAQVGPRLTSFESAVVGLTIYSTAFMGEAIRSGIQSVGRGQWQAAEASGLSFVEIMRLIILPQALALALPPLTNQWVRLVKNTSLLSVVAGGDILYHAIEISARTFAVVPVYITIALAYLALTVPLSRAADFFGERIAWRRAALRRDEWANATLAAAD